MAGADQEAVELGLRKRERSLELDRVLGRQHDERIRQRSRRPLDGDLPLLHRLEHGRLCSRGRPIDLVDQQDIREDRPGREAEGSALVQARTGDVGGQEVGRALDPIRLEPERPRDRSREKCLARSRHILDEDVTACQQGDRDQPERRLAADHGPADGLAEVVPKVARDPKLVGRARRRRRAAAGVSMSVAGSWMRRRSSWRRRPPAVLRREDFVATSRFDRTTR